MFCSIENPNVLASNGMLLKYFKTLQLVKWCGETKNESSIIGKA